MVISIKKMRSAVSRLLVPCIILLLICGPSPCGREPAYAQRKAKEYDLKASYIYRFILFVTWPEQAPRVQSAPSTDTITIGILGEDPFGTFFNGPEGQPVPKKNKVLQIKRLGPFREGLDLTSCQVLFISSSEHKNIKRIFAALDNRPVLTVAEMDNFCEGGGIIRLVTKGKRIRFEVNLDRARQVGLSLSANLLRAAIRVIQEEPKYGNQ